MKYTNLIILTLLFSCSEQIVTEVDHFENIYGISSKNLKVDRFQVNNNQNLSDILSEKGIDYLTIDQIASISKDVYDVRKMRSGNSYFILSSQDTNAVPQLMVYERNPIDFVVFNLIDSIYVSHGSKPITIDTVETVGKIDGSLWVTMNENKDDPNLAIELSEIYAWTINFFGLHQGDSYKIVYEKTYADTQYIGIGNIISTSFRHGNTDNYAFYFKQDSIGDYFDEAGGSLRRAFLKAPLRFSRISSRFSYSRKHPILKIRRPHLGVDYVAPIGTPVHSIGDGIVVRAGNNGQAGRMVQIKHNGTYSTSYLHLSRYGNGIRVGNSVKQGQVVGYVGSSGLSTGPHLDFRFYKSGKAVDPLKVKSPPVRPVNAENLESFNEIMDYWKNHLDNMELTSPVINAVIDSV